jgi:hypothetical protein
MARGLQWSRDRRGGTSKRFSRGSLNEASGLAGFRRELVEGTSPSHQTTYQPLRPASSGYYSNLRRTSGSRITRAPSQSRFSPRTRKTASRDSDTGHDALRASTGGCPGSSGGIHDRCPLFWGGHARRAAPLITAIRRPRPRRQRPCRPTVASGAHLCPGRAARAPGPGPNRAIRRENGLFFRVPAPALVPPPVARRLRNISRVQVLRLTREVSHEAARFRNPARAGRERLP